MRSRALRSPKDRVGTWGNSALPPPDRAPGASLEAMLHRALVRRDERALRAVIDELRPEMLRAAFGHVRSTDDAEDVIQDTWIAALSGIDRFEGRASLKTWVLRILTYRARSTARRGRRMVPLSQLPGWSDQAGPMPFLPVPTPAGTDPSESVIGRDLLERVEAALAGLPPRQREVVRLRDLEGWTPAEVCARLRVSTANQRVLLHRGRLQLRARVVR